MLIRNNILGIIFSAVLLGSCAPMYIPNTVNTPLLAHEGELQLAIYGGTAGFDPQVAYAVTNHIGVMANGSFQFEENDSSDYSNTHTFFEGGIGYYGYLSERIRFEIYGGYGGGKINGSYENTFWSDYRETSIKRIFIQPNIGLSTATIDLGLATRFVIVNASQGVIEDSHAFLEPAATIQAGFKYVKFVGQFGLSAPLGENTFIYQQPVIISLGVKGYIAKGFSR